MITCTTRADDDRSIYRRKIDGTRVSFPLHERREQSEHLSRVKPAFLVLRVASPHVLLAPSQVHGLPEYVFGRGLAEVLAGAAKTEQTDKRKITKPLVYMVIENNKGRCTDV